MQTCYSRAPAHMHTHMHADAHRCAHSLHKQTRGCTHGGGGEIEAGAKPLLTAGVGQGLLQEAETPPPLTHSLLSQGSTHGGGTEPPSSHPHLPLTCISGPQASPPCSLASLLPWEERGWGMQCPPH